MSDTTDGEYFDAIEVGAENKASENNTAPLHDGATTPTGQEDPSPRAVYFELEDGEDECAECHSLSEEEEVEEVPGQNEVVAKDKKFKGAKANFKKINNMVKSKVDVLSRAKVFGGKKKAGKQGKEKDKKRSSTSSMDGGDKMNLLARESSVEDVAQEALSLNTSAVGGATSHMQDPQSPGALSGGDTANSLYALAQPIPNEAADNDMDQSGTYAVPSMIPTAVNVSSSSSSPSPQQVKAGNQSPSNPAGKKKLHYMSSKVPLPGDPGLSQKTDSLKSTTSILSSSGNKGCQGGVGGAVPVNFITPHQMSGEHNENSSEYSRLYSKSTEVKLTEAEKERLRARGYGTLASVRFSTEEAPLDQSRNQDPDFDASSEEDEADLSFDWGSEFDESEFPYQDDDEIYSAVGGPEEEAPEKPLPVKPGKSKAFLSKAAKSGQSGTLPLDDPSSTVCLPVMINPDKHPPPVLPPFPSDLTEDQKKRRMIVDLIIGSERSYLESLERVIKEYEKPMLEFIPHSKSHLRPVFATTREIVSHHKMFQIELAETAKVWDQDEKIGDIFTASFSKTMLVNSYSKYVNAFAAAMEEIRTLQRNKPSFADFLRKQEKLSMDRLSIFGLMVKPVQRFPQFIMFLQDLIKYTPQTHHDRRALQLALTELENVAYRLNERKRQSEQKFQAQQTIQQLIRQKVQHMLNPWNLDPDVKRRFIRSDTVEQVHGEFGNMRCKERRLILMNDMVLCVKVLIKEQSGYSVERLALRWMAKLRDLELKDTAITPDMQSVIRKEPGKTHIISSQLEKPVEDPFHLYADLSDMLHDYTVLGQISGMLASLKRSYAGHGLQEELIHEVSRDLQRMIQIKDEQLRLVNSCSIILEDTSRSDKPHYVLQAQTAGRKQDWCVDFMMAKLAMDKLNNLAWDHPSGSDEVDFQITPANFIKYLPVDVPRNYTKVKCAVSIFLNPDKSSIGVQHLWVCSSTPERGQVSVLSIHNSKPALMESFKACNCDIMAAELVPGCGQTTTPQDYLFAEDTVWVCTAHCEILIYPLTGVDGVHRNPLSVVRTPAVTVAIKFVDERIFCGFDDGAMQVFSRNAVGGWDVPSPTPLQFGQMPVKIHFVHHEDIYLSCANKFSVMEIDSLQIKATHSLNAGDESPIDQVVQSGVGVWVSFHDSSVIKLFHIESMETLQEISVGNFVNRMRTEKLWSLSGPTDTLVVTSLAVSKGLLWIGTSLGVVLTVPLPRLSDGVPLYRGNPNISLHAHRGSVKFLIPMQCSSSVMEVNKASTLRSTLRSRQSKRNVEREKLELEESEKRKVKKKTSSTASDSSVANRRSWEGGAAMGTPDQQEGRNTLPSASTPSSGGKEGKKSGGEKSFFNFGKQSSAEKIDKHKHSDDSSIELRKGKGRVNLPNRKSQTLSFRSELAQRIMVKSSSLSRSDLDLSAIEPNEVEVLYEVLLEDDPDLQGGENDVDLYTDAQSMDEGNPTSSNPESKVTTPSWLNHQSSKSKTQGKNEDSKPTNIPKTNAQVKCSPSSSSAASTSTSSSSSSKQDNSSTFLSSAEHSPSPTRGFLRGGTTKMTTMRRMTSNAVIVISGGDGYCDLDPSRSQYKTDEACVMLWIYKF